MNKNKPCLRDTIEWCQMKIEQLFDYQRSLIYSNMYNWFLFNRLRDGNYMMSMVVLFFTLASYSLQHVFDHRALQMLLNLFLGVCFKQYNAMYIDTPHIAAYPQRTNGL